MREKKWVTAVTTSRDFGERTTYLYTDKPTTFREWDGGIVISTDDGLLMYVSHTRLISVEFDTEDPNEEANKSA